MSIAIASVQRFVEMHVLVSAHRCVQKGHDLLERIEADIKKALIHVTGITHLEPWKESLS